MVRSGFVTQSQLHLNANWHYEESGPRQHYVIEAWLGGQRTGRAHGWFEEGRQFVLEKIEMDRSQRSRGYGTAMIEQLRAKAREKRCGEFMIQGVRAANRGAIRLYESLGAKPTQTDSDIYAYVISPP